MSDHRADRLPRGLRVALLARRVLFDFIEVFNNRKRRHSFLGYDTPE